MKKTFALLLGLGLSPVGFANDDPGISQSVIKCAEGGCEMVCHQPGNRWDTFLKTAGDIQVTRHLHSGSIQYKADVGNGRYTILESHPAYQACRITGVAE